MIQEILLLLQLLNIYKKKNLKNICSVSLNKHPSLIICFAFIHLLFIFEKDPGTDGLN